MFACFEPTECDKGIYIFRRVTNLVLSLGMSSGIRVQRSWILLQYDGRSIPRSHKYRSGVNNDYFLLHRFILAVV